MLTRTPFDILAETYDENFVQSQTAQLQRDKVWFHLEPFLKSRGRTLRILEINCGTGEDAIRLAKMGHEVVGTDASPTMIAVSSKKAETLGMGNLRFVQCSFNEIGSKFSKQKFDLVFSNFAGINCANSSEISQLGKNFCTMLRPDGHLFFVVLSRFCLWELLYYGIQIQPRVAFRRWRKNNLFVIEGHSMPVYYYSPRGFAKLFNPYFVHDRSYPVGLFLPPTYMEKSFAGHQSWLNKLNKWEYGLGKRSAFSSLADHYCIILKKESV
ncbi:MAG: class I SAM-dependent methyltransferase [Bacteroidetes bacterium]|nr:class I SAM-dependent methyltransferase [Bacteroidota bacterium]